MPMPASSGTPTSAGPGHPPLHMMFPTGMRPPLEHMRPPGVSGSYLTLSLLAATCRLLITFANSFDPDQDRLNVGPDLDPNCLTI